MHNKLFIPPIILLCLGGCATMNESECLNADWRIIGMEDGADGHLPSYLGEHRTACASYNVRPNLDAYMQGHQLGVQQYCTPSNGYNVGKQGKTYNGVCPPEREAEFLAAYDHGYEHYILQRELDDIDSSIRYKSDSIDDLKEKITELEKQIISDGTAEAQRASLLEQVKEHQSEISYLETEIVDFNRNKIILNDRLQLHNQQYHY